MNKEEMEKKRNEFALKSFNGDPLSGFKAGWDACAKEYEKEIERLNDNIRELFITASYWENRFDELSREYQPLVGSLTRE